MAGDKKGGEEIPAKKTIGVMRITSINVNPLESGADAAVNKITEDLCRKNFGPSPMPPIVLSNGDVRYSFCYIEKIES